MSITKQAFLRAETKLMKIEMKIEKAKVHLALLKKEAELVRDQIKMSRQFHCDDD